MRGDPALSSLLSRNSPALTLRKARKLSVDAYTREDIEKAFAILDTDGSGTISAQELAAILTWPTPDGQPLNLSEAKALIRKFDANGDRELQKEEFVEAFTTIRSVVKLREREETETLQGLKASAELDPMGA